MDFRPLSELKPQPIEWFWPGYLSVGSLAILDGDPGQGKSLVTLDLAARITTGRPWPDGAAMPGPAPVLLICSEDVESVIHARLQSADADLDRVFLWPRHDGRLPSFPADGLALDAALLRTGARFIVIDPVMSFLDRSVMSSSDASVRRALGPLAQLADKHGCVVLLVRHLSKRPGSRALYRGGGSIGFVAACRFGWLAAHDPCLPDRYVLAQTKSNYVPQQTSLSYAIAGDGVPRIDWLGSTSWIADELAARRPKPSRRLARDFLKRFLAGGPRTSAEVWSAAQNLGLGRRTIFRAKEDLHIRTVRSPTGPRNSATWFLPGHDTPAPPSETPALDAWLRRFRELHSGPPGDPDDLARRHAG